MFYNAHQLTSNNCDKLNPVKKMAMFNGRITKATKFTKFDCMQSHFEYDFNAETAKRISQEFIRKIKARRKVFREMPEFADTVRNEVLYLHDYNLTVFKTTQSYPLSEEYSQLLLQYALLECKILYKREYYSKSAETRTQNRVLRLLLNIYNDYFESKLMGRKEITDRSIKAIIEIIIKIKTQFNLNYTILENMTVALLKKNGQFEKINALRGKQLSFSVEGCLSIDPSLSSIYRTVTTSDYGTDDGSSNGPRIFTFDDDNDCDKTENSPKISENASNDDIKDVDFVENRYEGNSLNKTAKKKMVYTICLDESGLESDEELVFLDREIETKKTEKTNRRGCQQSDKGVAIKKIISNQNQHISKNCQTESTLKVDSGNDLKITKNKPNISLINLEEDDILKQIDAILLSGYDAETDQKAIVQKPKTITDDISDDDFLDESPSKNCESEDAKSAKTSVPDASNQNNNKLSKLNDSDEVVLLDEEEIDDEDWKIVKKVQTVTQKDPISVNVADSSVTILDSDSPDLPIEAGIKSNDANSPSTEIDDAFVADSTDVSSSGLPSSSTSDYQPLSKNLSSNILYNTETVCDVTTSDITLGEKESTKQFKEVCADDVVKKEVSAIVRDVKKAAFVAKDIRINLYQCPVPQAKKRLPKQEQAAVTHEEAIANDRITHDNCTPKFKERVAPIKNDEELVEASNEEPAKSSDTLNRFVSDEEVARAELIHQGERDVPGEGKKETSQYVTAEVITTEQHRGKADSSVNKSEDESQFDEVIATDRDKTETVEKCNVHKETNLVTTSENLQEEHSETETGKTHVLDESSSEKADVPDTLNYSRPSCEIVVDEENSCSAINERSCDSKPENVTQVSNEAILDGKEMKSHCNAEQDIVSKNEEQIHETDDATTTEPEKVSEDFIVESHKFKDTHLDDDLQENIHQPSDEFIPEFSKKDSLVSSSKTVEETRVVPVKLACKYSLRSHKESDDAPLDTDSIQEEAQNETTIDTKDTSPTHCKTTDDIHLADANSVSQISEQQPASPIRTSEKRYSLRSYCDFEEKYLAALQASKQIVDHTETADPETFERTHLVVAAEPLVELDKEVEVKRAKPDRKYSLRSHREIEDINFSDIEEQVIHQTNQNDEVVDADAVKEVDAAKSIVGDHEEKISEALGIEGKEEHQKVSSEKEEEIEQVTESILGEKEERNKKNIQADNSENVKERRAVRNIRQAEEMKKNEDKNSDKTHLVESIVKEQIEEVGEIGCDESIVDEKNSESTENKIEPQTIPDLNQSEKELREIKNHEDRNTEDTCLVDTERLETIHQLKDVEKTLVIEKVDDTRSKVGDKNSETQIKHHLSEDEKKTADLENIQENKLLTDANTLSDITEGKPTNSFLQDEKIVQKVDNIEEANRNVITDHEKTINERVNLADTGPQMQVTHHDVTQIPEIEGVEEIVTETVTVKEMSNENIEETPHSVDNSVEVSHEYSICKSPFINEVIVETPVDKEDVSLDIGKVVVRLQEDHEERYTDSNVDVSSQNEEILLTELHPIKNEETDAVTVDLNKIEEIRIPEDKIKNSDQTSRFEKCNQDYIEGGSSKDVTPSVLEETKTNLSDPGIINTLLHNKDLVLNNCAMPQVQTVQFLHNTIKTASDVVESQFSKNNSLVDYFTNKTEYQEVLQKQESPVPNKVEVLFEQGGAGYCNSRDPDISDWNIYKEEVVQAEVSTEPCVDLHLLASAAVEIIKQKSETPTLDMFKGRRRRSKKAKNRAKSELLKRDPKKLKTDRSVKRKLRKKLNFNEGAELIEDGKRVTRSAYRKNIFECVMKPQEFKTILPINNVKIHQLPDSVAVKDSTDSDSNDSECNKLFIDDKKDEESETLIYNEDTAEESFLFCYEPRLQCLEEENKKDEEPKIYSKTKTKAEYKSYDSNLNPYVRITRLEKKSENQNKGSADLPLHDVSLESNAKKSETAGENDKHCDVIKPNENTETVTEDEENKNKSENDYYSLITNREPLNFSTSTPPKLRYKLACRNTVKFTAEKLEKRLKKEVEKPLLNTPEVARNETERVDVDTTDNLNNKPDENDQVDMVILERKSFDIVEDVPLNIRLLQQSKEVQDQNLNLKKEPSPISSKSLQLATSQDISNDELNDVLAISSSSATQKNSVTSEILEITETVAADAVKEDIDTSNNSKETERKTSERIKDDIDITSISRQLKKKISIATTGQRETSDITKKSQKYVKIKTTAVKESVGTSNISKESQKKIIENIEDCNMSTKSENRISETVEAICSKEQIDKSNSSKISEKKNPDTIDDVAKHTDTPSSKKDGNVLEKIENSSAKKHKIDTTIDASNISKKSKSKIYEKVQAAAVKGHIDASNRSKKLEKKISKKIEITSTKEHIGASNISRKSQKNIPEQVKTVAVADLSKSKKTSVIEEPEKIATVVSTTHMDTSKKSKKKTTEIIETAVANTDSANISKKSEKKISGVTETAYTSKKLCKEIPENTVASGEHTETSDISMKKIPDTIETAVGVKAPVDTSAISKKSQKEIPKTVKTTVAKELIEASSGLKKPEREVPEKTKVIDNSKRSKRLDKIVKEKIAVDEKTVASNNSKETVIKEQVVDKKQETKLPKRSRKIEENVESCVNSKETEKLIAGKIEAIVAKEHVTKFNTSKNQEGDITEEIAVGTETPKIAKESEKLLKEKIEIPVREENIESSSNSKETDTGDIETVVNKEHVNKSRISKKQARDIIENIENTVIEKCFETNKKSKRPEKIIKENVDIPAVEGKLESSTNSKKTVREIPVKIETAIKEHVDKYNASKVPEESMTEKNDSMFIEKCTETLRKSNRLEKIIKEKMKISAVKEEIDESNTSRKAEKAIIEKSENTVIEKCTETPKRSNRQTDRELARKNETATKAHANQFNTSKKLETDITENIANTVIAKPTQTPKISKKPKNIIKEIKRPVPEENIESSTNSKETADKQIPRKIETIVSNENVDKSNTSKSRERDVVENMVIDKCTETNKKSKRLEKIMKKNMKKSAVKVEIDPSYNSEGTVTDERVDKSNTSKKQERNLTEKIEHTIINKCTETPSNRLEKTKEKIESTSEKEEIGASNNLTGTDRAQLGKIKTVDTEHVDEPSISKKPEKTITDEQIGNTVIEKYTETPKRSNRLEKIAKEKTESPAGEEKVLNETDTEISQKNETVSKEHADKSNTSTVSKTENTVTEKLSEPPKKSKKLENILKERIKSPAREEKIESSTNSKETDRDIPENMETVVNKKQVDKSKTSRKSRKNIPKKIDTTAVKGYTDSFIISKKEISKNITPTDNIEDLGKSTDPSNIPKEAEKEPPAASAEDVVKNAEVSASIQSEKRLPENIISAEILFDNAVDLQLYTGNVTNNCDNAAAKVTVDIPESKKITVLSNVMISPKKTKSDVYYSCLQGTKEEIENKPDVGCKSDALILDSSIEISVKEETEIKDTSPIKNDIKDTQKGVRDAVNLKPEETEIAKNDPIQSKSIIKEGQKGKSPIKDTSQSKEDVKEIREAISPTRKSFMFEQKEIDQLIEKYSEDDKRSCRKSNRRRKSNVEKGLEKKIKVNDKHEGRKSTFVSSSIENEEINIVSTPDKIELRSSRNLRSKSYTAETRTPAESPTEKKLRSKSVSIAECKKILETSAKIKDFPKIATNVEEVSRRGNKRRRSSSRSVSSDKHKQDTTTSSNKIIEETPLEKCDERKNSSVSKLKEEVNTTQSKRILRTSTTKIEKEEGQMTSKLQKRSKKSAAKMKRKTSAIRDSQLMTSDNMGSEIKISEEKFSSAVLDEHDQITQEITTNTEKNKNVYENVSVLHIEVKETIVKDTQQLRNVSNEDKEDVELTAVDDGSSQKSPDLEQIISHADEVSEIIDKDKIDLNSATEKYLSTANKTLSIENVSSEQKRDVQVEFYSESLEDLKEEIQEGPNKSTVSKLAESKDAPSALEDDYSDNSVLEKVPELDTNCFAQPSEEISVTSQPLEDKNEVVEKEEEKIENTSEDVSKKSLLPQTGTKFRDLVIQLENRPAVEFYGSFIASRVPSELSEHPINVSKNKDIPTRVVKGTKRRNQCLRKESKNRAGPQFDESYQTPSKIKRMSGRYKKNIKDAGKVSEKTKIVKSNSRKGISLVKLRHAVTKSETVETRFTRRKSKASLESSSNKIDAKDTVSAKEEEETDVFHPLADPNLAQTLPEESIHVKEDSSKVLPVDVGTTELNLLTNKQVMETTELKMEKEKFKEPESKEVLCGESKIILADAETVRGSDLTTIDQSSEVREPEVKCSFANQDSALIIPEEVKKDENVSTAECVTDILNLPIDQEIVSELKEDILTTKVDNTEIFPSNSEDSSKECGNASTEKECITNNQESEVPELEVTQFQPSRTELVEESLQDQNSTPKIPEEVKDYNTEELVSSDILHLSMKEEIVSSTKSDNVENSATNHKYICESASILKEFVINDPSNEVSEKYVTPEQPNDVYKCCRLSEDNRSLENPEAITEEDEKVEEYNSSEVMNCAINTSNMSNNNEFVSAEFEAEPTLPTVGLKAVNDSDIVSKDSTNDLVATEEVASTSIDQPSEVPKEDVAAESQPNVDKFDLLDCYRTGDNKNSTQTLPQVNENVQEYTSTESITSIKENVAHTDGKDLIGQQTFVNVAVPNISTVNSSGTSELLCSNVVVTLPGFEQSSQVPVMQPPDNKISTNSLETPDLENILNNVPFFNNQILRPNIPNIRDISSSEFNTANIEMPKIPSPPPILQQTEVRTSQQADLVVNEQINKENGVVAAHSTRLDKFGSELHQNLQNSEILNSAEKLETTTTNTEFKNAYADMNAQGNEKTELPHAINDFKFPTVAALPSRKRKMPPEDHATLPKRCRTRIVTDIYDSEPPTSTGIYARKQEQRYIESVFNRLKENTTWDIPDAPYEEEVVATEDNRNDAYSPTLEEISNSLMAANENQNQSLLPATEQALVYRDLDTDVSPSDFDFFTKLFVTKTTSYVVEQRAFPIKKPKHIPSYNTSHQSFGITSEQTVSSNFGPKYRDLRSQKISIVKSRTISLTENNVCARPENMQNGAESRITSKKEITMFNFNNHGAFGENNSSLDGYFAQGNRHGGGGGGGSNSQMRGGENVPSYPCSENVANGADTRITSKNEITLFNFNNHYNNQGDANYNEIENVANGADTRITSKNEITLFNFNNHYNNQGDANYNEILSADNYYGGGGSQLRAITDAENMSSGDTRIRPKNEIALFNFNNNYNQGNSDLEIYSPQGNQHGVNSQLKAITDGTNDHNYSYYAGDPVMSMADDGNDNMSPNAKEFENVILNFGNENEFLDSTSSLLDLDLPDENASRRESEPYPAWDNEPKVIVLPNEQYINHHTDTPVVITEHIVDNSVPEPWVQEESVTDEVQDFRNANIVLFNQQDNSLNQQGDFNPGNVLTEEIPPVCQPETLQTTFDPCEVSIATDFQTETLQNSFNSNPVLTEQIPATCQTETLENNMELPDANLELYNSLSLTDDAVTEEPDGSLVPTNNAKNLHTGIAQCIISGGNTFTDKPETEKPKTERSAAPVVPEQPVVHTEKSDRPKDEDSPHKNTGKSKRVEQQLALYRQLQAEKKLKQEGQNDEKQKSGGGIPSRQYLRTRPGEWTKLSSGSPPTRNSPTRKQQVPVEVEKPNRSSDKAESLATPKSINTDDATIKAAPISVPMTNGLDNPADVEPLTVEKEKVVEKPIKIPKVKGQKVFLKDVSIVDERQENNLEKNRHDTKNKPTTGHRYVVIDEATKLSKQPHPKPHFSPPNSNSVDNARTKPTILNRRGSEVSARTEDPSKYGYLSKKSPLPSPSRESKPSSKELKRSTDRSRTPPTRTSEKPPPIIKRNPHECRDEPGSLNMMPSRNRGSSEIPQDRVPGSRSEVSRERRPGGSSKMSRGRVPGYSSEIPHTRVSGNGSEMPRARVPVNSSEMSRTRVLINPSELYDRIPRGSSEIHDRVPGGGGTVPVMDLPRDKVPERDANTQSRGRVPKGNSEFDQIPAYENLEVSPNVYDIVKSRKRAATKRDSSVESNVPPSRSHHVYRTRRKSKKSPDAAVAAAAETFYNQLPEKSSKTPRNVQQGDDRAPSNNQSDLKITIRLDNSNAQYTTYSSSPGSYSKPSNNHASKYTIDEILNKSKGPSPKDSRKYRTGNYERSSSGNESSNKPKVVQKSHDAFDDLLKKGTVNPYFHSTSNSKNQRPEDCAQSAYKRSSERSNLEAGYSNKRRLDGQTGPWKIRRDSSQGYGGGGSSSRSNPEFGRARQEQRPSNEYKYPSSSYRDSRDGSGYFSRKPSTSSSSSSNPPPQSHSSSGYYTQVLNSYRRKEEHVQHPKKDTQPYTGKGIVLSEEKKNELLEDLKNMVQMQLNKSAKNNSEADWYQGLTPLLSDNPHGLSKKE